jgi:DNA-binding NarL/FixJ family response regulator
MSEPARVALVDDVPVFRIGLRAALERDSRFTVVLDTGSPLEAIERAHELEIAGAAVDLAIAEMRGPPFVSALCQRHAGIKILVLSLRDEPMQVAQTLRAGALGYIDKRAQPVEICEAFARVLVGERYLPAERQDIERLVTGLDAWPLDRLTCREKEVFMLMVEGCSNEDIADRLFIARRTVETHRHHVMNKLSARSIVDLVRIALRSGIPVT